MRLAAANAAAAAALFALVAACAPPPETAGRRIFDDNCTGCHGSSARGNGPYAAALGRPVPDLTRIAARNGGIFPMAGVLSTIDGYTRAREGRVTMPEFGLILEEGQLVTVDTGDGIPTPVPERLWALAQYLETIQR